MKKKELYYLIINARTAKEKLSLSYVNLAELIGVYFGTIEKWFNHKQEPSDLNLYKLNWFVYLVLDMNISYDSLKKDFSLVDLTLYTNPIDTNGHFEPWNNTDALDCKNNSASAQCQPDELPFDFDDEDSFEKYLASECNIPLDELITYDKELFDNGTYNIYDIFNEQLKLWPHSIQESIKRVNNLIDLCDMFLDLLNWDLKFDDIKINEIYSEVHDFKSFVHFLEVFNTISEDNENYNLTDGTTVIEISYYTNPLLKSVNTKVIEHIEAYSDCIVITCKDSTVYELPADSSFEVNAASALRSPDFNFMCKVDNDYYSISFKRQ